MAYYLRSPKNGLGHGTYVDGEFHWMEAAPLVMHDACAGEHPEVVANPHHTDREGFWAHHNARQAFADQFGEGYTLCWDRSYSDRPDAPSCFYCNQPVVGRG